jgi:hypothetical protein
VRYPREGTTLILREDGSSPVLTQKEQAKLSQQKLHIFERTNNKQQNASPKKEREKERKKQRKKRIKRKKRQRQRQMSMKKENKLREFIKESYTFFGTNSTFLKC